ncbi:uncharacterized protein LOC111916201 [Lactuca sativa]|uniref:uncharacterized protein LOC111916201 n=1 Tax=Lactuca sativa TaxID=4236 RepID=UPI0022AFC347|nr:uncharacterized protein LOC111916201 [Lactuca sativa]
MPSVSNPNATPQTLITNQSIPSVSNATSQTQCSNQPNDNVDLKDLPKDPTDRPLITSYKPNIRDDVRRAYLLQGPCQVRAHKFPKKIGDRFRRFVPSWFDDFDWLEYSVKKDSAYCLYCYLCGDLMGQKGGRDAFVSQGFDTWNKKDAFWTHVGGIDSFHNKAKEKCEFLMREKHAINVVLRRQTEAEDHKYKARLRVSIIVVRLLLKTGLPFRGHDESVNSENRGLYIEVLKAIRETSEDIFNNTLENAPKNNQLISPKIQKELVQCFAQEVLLSIREEIGQDVFALLVNESSDVSKKEQMAIVLRYVDTLGFVKERFIGLVHVKDTSSLTLKNAINEVLTSNKLSFSQIRGQGYDGASNMRGEFNVVAVAKKHDGVSDFFEQISLVVNVVCASCKKKDLLREQARERVQKGLCSGELETGRGLNQETTLVRVGETRWGSHFNTLTSLMKLFADVSVVLDFVKEEGGSLANRQQASGILAYFKSYEFVFYLHMMYDILHLTGTLSKQLQRKDLDILEAASMVRGTMVTLQSFRNIGFASILPKVSSFCETHEIDTLDMEELYIGARNRRTTKTNRFHFEVEIFNTVVDMQLTEYRDRFSETSTQLLEYMGALSPCDSFAQFDKSKLLKLGKLYKYDFDDSDMIDLEGQLEIFYHSRIKDERFASLKGIFDLSRLMASKIVLNHLESLRNRISIGVDLEEKMTRGFRAFPDSLWVKMVKVIHGKHGLLDNPNCYKGHDLVWVNVIKVVDVLWLGDTPLKMQFLRIYALEQDKQILVSLKMLQEGLLASLRCQPRGGTKRAQYDQLLQFVGLGFALFV